jgi:hypothetical protein
MLHVVLSAQKITMFCSMLVVVVGIVVAVVELESVVVVQSLARPGRKQATATEGFDFHISYL